MTHSCSVIFFGLAPFGSVKHNTSIPVYCARCYTIVYTITLITRDSLLFVFTFFVTRLKYVNVLFI